MSWLFKRNYILYTSDISCRDTRSTNCNQLYTPKPNCELFRKSFVYSGTAIWSSLPLHVKNATSVKAFESLYLKRKRLNEHWIIILVLLLPIWFCMLYWFSQWFCIFIDLINAYFMSLILPAWFGIDVLVSVYYSLLWHATTLLSFIYTWSLLHCTY